MAELKGGFTATDDRLGRLPSFDERSLDYSVPRLLEEHFVALPPRKGRTWPNRWITDQEGGRCVAHAHKGRLANPPVVKRWDLTDQQLTRESQDVFVEYQRADEWPGELPAYDGTSVLAGAKVEKAKGNYESYWWASSTEEAVLAIDYVGTVIFGIPWLESMFVPRPSGLLEVHGNVAGGHAIRGRGVLLKARLRGEGPKPKEVMRWPNSWSRRWGNGGECYILLEDLDRLRRMDGECCVPVEPGQLRARP